MHQTINPARLRSQRRGRVQTLVWLFFILLTLCGCTNFYRRSADREVYKIVQQKQAAALGQTNAFSIDTRYSSRKPEDVKAQEIIEDRTQEAKLTLTLQEALRTALENSREYQNRKEQLYLSALTLTAERFEFVPQFFANTAVIGEREPSPLPGEGSSKSVRVSNGVGVSQLLKTGGRVSLDLANDFLRFDVFRLP